MLPKKLIVIIFTTFYHYLLLLLLFLGVRQATAASFTWTWLVCAPKSSSVSQQGQIKWHRPGSLPTTHTLSRSLSLSLSLSVCLSRSLTPTLSHPCCSPLAHFVWQLPTLHASAPSIALDLQTFTVAPLFFRGLFCSTPLRTERDLKCRSAAASTVECLSLSTDPSVKALQTRSFHKIIRAAKMVDRGIVRILAGKLTRHK